MRNRVAISFLILSLGGLILLLEATEGYAQRGGGQFKFPGGGKGDFKFDPSKIDPSRIFQFISNGQSYIEISKVWKGREELELFAKRNNISDGKINLEQYKKFWEQREQLREEVQKNGGGSSDKGGKGKGKGFFGDPEAMFKQLDTNGDGYLNEDEIQQTRRFKDEWKNWDKDKDGRISLDEWKAYSEAQAKAREARREEKKDGDKKDEKKDEKKESITRIELEEVENVRPIVYYGTNLPKELPPWFSQLDTNKDGQVSLMEWVKGGKPMNEFSKWDRNDDGLITPEEVLRELGLNGKAGEAVATGPAGNGPGAFGKDKGGFRGPGGFGKGGGFRGPGGFGKGGGGKGKRNRGGAQDP
jgi:Ca2+-binding EF-hand superfamily protein